MSSVLCRGFFKTAPSLIQSKVVTFPVYDKRFIFLQSCLFRAKKSTRERKLKYHRKQKARKAGALLNLNAAAAFIRRKKKNKELVKQTDDSLLPACEDDVWFTNMFKLRRHSFAEAVNALREFHHPTIFNDPNAFLYVLVELDMSTDKKTKFFENFTNVVDVKYPYLHGEDRSIVAFCKTREQVESALEAGATLAGGSEIITAIKRGNIVLPDFQFFIAHPTILTELSVIRGLLRNNYPSLEKGTLTPDLPSLIAKLKVGIRYESKRDEVDPRYGCIDVSLGLLNTEIEHLEDNLRLILGDIRGKGPRRTKNTENYKFLKRCFIHSQLQAEKLLISADDYLEEEEIVDSDDEDDDTAAGQS